MTQYGTKINHDQSITIIKEEVDDQNIIVIHQYKLRYFLEAENSKKYNKT